MENKIIEVIIKGEKKAEEILEKAKIDCSKIIFNAENTSEKIKTKALEDNKKNLKEKLTELENKMLEDYNLKMENFYKNVENKNLEEKINIIASDLLNEIIV